MNGPNANATIQARQRLVPICRTLSQGGLQQGMHQEGALVLERLHTPETQYLARRSTATDRTDQISKQTLLEWSERVLSANRLDEVLH